MSVPVLLAAGLDLGLVALIASRLWKSRHRGQSLRMRIFAALAAAGLLGALATGLYAVALDRATLGFVPRLGSLAPKAFVLASAVLAVAAAGAALAGRRLARSVELLADAASRIAEGQRSTLVPFAHDDDGRRIARALATLCREVEDRPYAAAFLRDAWHDLKTPLAAIRASVELLEDGALEDPAVARRFVGHVARSAEDLDRMLTDLVTLARLETASLAEETHMSVGALVTRAMATVEPLAAARGVELVTAERCGRKVRCDASALARAIGNLLENAVEATPGGRVEVSLADGEGAAGGVTVDVMNEPATVAREVRERLFQRAPSGKKNGTGLGLAIARAAVEAHGGRVRFLEMGPPRVTVRIELP